MKTTGKAGPDGRPARAPRRRPAAGLPDRQRAIAFWQAIDAAPPREVVAVCRRHLAPGFRWQGPAPWATASSPEDFAESFLLPMRRAFPEQHRLTHILIAGLSNGRIDGTGDGRPWVGATGYLVGPQAAEVAGLPAVASLPRPLRLRWSDFLRFEGEAIVEGQSLIDLADWAEQIGRPMLPPSRGAPFVWPAPTGLDGLLGGTAPQEESALTLELCRGLLFAGLNAFDRKSLGSMGMAGYFHANVKWYGPGGIGACLSLQEFEQLHQQPWLVGFPDRRVQDLDNLIAEGPLVGCSAFPGVRATHGGTYLDVPATGRPLAIHGIDFWRREAGRFTENWVFVDMPHLFAQMGVDLLERVRPGRTARQPRG